MNIESNRSLRADNHSAAPRSYFSSLSKNAAWVGLSIVLASCGGEDPAQTDSQAVGGLKPKVAVAGQSLVGLGPLSSANLAAFDADRNGAVIPDGSAVATSHTEASGVFELLVPAEHTGLVVTSFGGSYIDQTDQNQDGDPRREFTLGSTETAVQTWLPAGEEVVVLNLLTEALYIKSLGEASGGNFDEIFQTNRDKAAESVGFDIVGTLPSNPIDPASTDLDASKQYGMFLGGLAGAVNAVAAKLGLAAPDADLLRAIALDLVDGELDGTIRGVEISVEAGFLPNDVDLKSEIIRFRNNNFQSYDDVELVEFDNATFGEPTVVPNRAPIAVDDPEYTTLRGETLLVTGESGVLSNDSDPDGDSLTAVLDGTAPSATLVLDSDGGFSFAPATDAIGSQTFSYIATDSELNSEPAVVTVTILNVAPTAVDDSVTLAQGGGASINVLNNDSDDTDGLEITQVDTPSHGSASIQDDRIVYQHAGDSIDTDVFGYQITDADGATATATLSVAIIPGNKAPVVANPIASQVATEEQQFDFVFADNVFVDEDGDQLSYIASQVGDLPLPSWLGFVAAQRRFIGTPDEPDLESFDIELEALDGNGGSASLTFALNVVPVNDAPTIAPIADLTVDEDASISPISVSVADIETPSSLVVTATSSNQTLLADASINITGAGSNRSLALTPAANENGAAVITVTVSDGTDSSSETFTLSVNPVNDQPTITPIADVTIDEDQAGGPLAFTVADLESPASDLGLQAVSNDQTLIANADIQIQGVGESRSIDFQPLADAFGSAEITVTVDDGDLSQQISFTVTVTPVNDAPSFALDGNNEVVSEDAGTQSVIAKAISISAGPNEVEQAVSFIVVNDNNALFSDQPAITPDGDLSYTPAANASGVASVSVTAVDDGSPSASSSSQTFTITVEAVNDAPSFTLDGNDEQADEDSPPVTVLAKVQTIDTGAPDESDQSVSFTVTNDNNALFSVQPAINAAGDLSYTAAADANGSATVTVTAVDDGSPAASSASQTFIITINPVNDAPSFTLDGNNETVDEDAGAQTVVGKVASSAAGPVDESDQIISFTVSNDNNALFSVQPAVNSAGDLSYTAAADAIGSTIVTVTAVDDGSPAASSAGQTFTITVNPVNDAPDFVLDGNNETVDEDAGAQTAAGKVANSTAGPADESDQSVSFTVSNDNNALFSVQPSINAAGDLSYTPAANAFGVAVVSVTAVDDGSPAASSAPQSFSITINSVNDAASVSAVSDLNVNEDDPISPIAVTVDDVENGPESVLLTAVSSNQFVVADSALNITGSGANRSLQFDLVPNGNGVTTITLTADDGEGGTSSSSFAVNVAAVNDAPFFITTIGDQNSPEDIAVGPLSFSFDDVETSAGSLIRNVFSSDQTVIPNGSITVGGTGGNRTLSYTPVANISGTAVITVEISDGVNTTPFSFNATITPVNDAPDFVLDGNNETVDEDAGAQTVAGKVANSSAGPVDESDQTVSYTVSNDNNALFSAQPAIDTSGVLSYTPAPDANGSATVTVTAVDDGSPAASSASQTFTITINAVNDIPSFTLGGNETIDEDSGAQTLAGKATAISAGPSDESSQVVSFTVTNDNNALFSLQPAINAAGDLSFTAASDANGSATVTVTAVDDGSPAANSASQTLTITINPVNDAPDFVLDGNNETTDEDSGPQTVAGKVANSSAGPVDESDQTISYTVSNDNNALFSAQPAIDISGVLTYTPAPDANGSATVTVTAVDDGSPAASSASQTFTITVNPVNDVPSFILDGNNESVNEDAGAQTQAGKAGNISAGPADESGQIVSFVVTNDNNALFSVQPAIDTAGQLTYTPAADANGVAVITVAAQDNGTPVQTSATQQFTITVTAVNDAPSFVLDGNQHTVGEDNASPTVIPNKAQSISAGPADESGQTVSFVVTNDNPTLFSVQPTIDAAGQLTFHSAPDLNGSAIVTVRADDDGSPVASSATQQFTITVSPVNDRPTFALDGNNETINEDAGAQTVANKAQDISAGPADESGQVVSFNVVNDNNALFSVQPSIDVTGQLSYTPAANANGSAVVTVTAVDDGSPALSSASSQAFTITVNAVNDAPSFALDGNNETVAEDAAAQTVAGKATAISAGPADESSQNLTFIVTNDNNALFSAQPVINAGGQLSYTVSPDVVGTAVVSVTLQDAGGVANGGVDTSATQTFSITVTEVNDTPTFALDGNNEAVNEDAGAQTVAAKVTSISPGPASEAGQTVSFNVTNSDNSLFSVQPAIDNSGQLTYTPAPDANGVAAVFVIAIDDGTPPEGTLSSTFSITVNAVNDAPSFANGGDVTVNEDAGAQSIAGQLNSIDSGAANEASQVLSFVVTNDNNSLFSVQPAIDASGTLTFTAAADANGVATVSVFAQDDAGTANGGADTSATQTFDVIVTAVNDVPSFTVGGGSSVLEDSGVNSINNFVNAISAGPADESTQNLTFIVSNDNNAIFAVQPTINAAGTLDFTTAADANGSATLSIQLQDDGTPNETSAVQTTSLSILPVNDAPSFVVGADQLVDDGAGPQTVSSFATAIAAGPANESGQTLSFTVSNDNNGIFGAQPAIDPTGTLTFTGAAPGLATVTVTLSDNGGTPNGGTNTSASQTFDIRVNALPVVDINNGLIVPPNSTVDVTAFDLSVSDLEDVTNVDIVVDTTICGGFELLGVPVSTFTQADINAGNMTFVQASCVPGTVQNESLRAVDQDGAEVAFGFEIRVENIQVNTASVANYETAHPQFDAVVLSFLDQSGNPPVLEADSIPGGVFVSRDFGTDAVVADSGADIVVTPTAGLFAGERVRIQVTPGLTSNTSAKAFPYLTEFYAASSLNGDGTFNPHPAVSGFAAGGSGAAVEFGDVDGDGDLDAVLADDPALQLNAVWLNDGTGVFTPHASFTNFGAEYFDIALADLNNDGSLDAVLTNNSKVDMFLNDGTGDFSAAGTSLSVANGFPVRVADLTGDGALDLVVGKSGANDGLVFVNDGGGNFAAHSTPSFGVNRQVRDIQSGDFDQDGDIDLFITSLDQQNLWLNDGSAVFTRVFITSGSDDMSAAPFDVDQDGDMDIILRRGVGGADTVQDIVVMRNDGTGSFTLEAEQNFPSLGADHSYIDWGDLDGDGDIDLISGRTSNVAVFLNDGNGTFTLTTQSQIVVAGPAKALDLADIDGDGDLDFIPSPLGSGEVEIWINNPVPVASLSNSTVDENLASFAFGDFSATLEGGEDAAFTLVSGAGSADNGLFEITFTPGGIYRLGTSASALNFESKQNYSVRVRVADTNGAANEQVFAITANDVNEAPVITALNGITVDEGAVGLIQTADLRVVDVDAAHGPAEVEYTLTTQPTNGLLRRGGIGLMFGDTFTQQDIDGDLLDYDHVGNETTSDVFSFSALDPEGLGVTGINFNITVTPVNDAPVVVTNAGITLAEGGLEPISNTVLTASDNDNAIADITFTVTTLPLNGQILRSGVPLMINGTFTVEDVDLGLVDYQHDGSETTTDSFTFSLTDPDGDGPTGQVFNMTVTAVNDLPVVAANTGATLNEGAGITITTVELQATDDDHAATDVTYTITAAPINGELRINGVPREVNGTFTQDDINLGLVTYQHDGGETTADSFTVSIADPVGTGPVGEVFSITVNAVNDAPVISLTSPPIDDFYVNAFDVGQQLAGSLVFSDEDAGASDVQLTLSTDVSVTLTISESGALAGKVAGNGTNIVQITAPIADINAELLGDTAFVANVDHPSQFLITFDLDDLGNAGLGGPLQDTAVQQISLITLELEQLAGADGLTLGNLELGAQLGAAVTNIGDFNADGFADYAVSAPNYATNPVAPSSFHGKVYVVYGNSSVSNGFDLDTLDGSNGFAILGADGSGDGGEDTQLGLELASAGDFNGDGIVDLLIGAPDSDAGEGRAYLIYGEAGRAIATLDLSNPDPSNFFKLAATAPFGGEVGASLAAGDFDRDGYSDLVIGAPEFSNGVGAVYVVYGDSSYAPGSLDAIDLNVVINDVATGSRFDGAGAADRAGKSVALGSVYGLGFDSLVIGANMSNDGGLGGVYVVQTSPTTTGPIALDTISAGDGTRIVGNASIDLGISVDVVPDMTGDGLGEIIIGARDATVDGTEQAGWLVPGFSVTPPAIASVTTPSLNAIELIGKADGDLTGHQVASVGDFNGDGLGDLLIGAAGSTSNSGDAYLIFGSAGLTGPTFDLGLLDGINGIRLTTPANSQLTAGGLGMAVSSAGDINGDGLDDLLVGARNAQPLGSATGAAYVIFGQPIANPFPVLNALSDTATTADEVILGSPGGEVIDGAAGNDILLGGSGDDVLVFDIDDIQKVSGGLGNDVLQMPDPGVSTNLSFPVLMSAAQFDLFSGIESVELPDAGRPDLYTFGPTTIQLMTDERNTLRVFGSIAGTAPRVNAEGAWLRGPQVTEGPVTYETFLSASSNVYLYVDQRIDSSNMTIVTLAEHVSQSTAGQIGDAGSNFAKISGNGRYVVYQSTAGNLDAAISTTFGRQHIYRTDLLTNETIMVSQLGSIEGDAPSYDPCISYDGGLISFATTAQNLVGTVVEEQIAVDVVGGVVGSPISLRVGSSTTGECDISSDGNFIAFYNDDEIYRHNTITGENVLISTDMVGFDVCSNLERCGGIALSGDGQKAVFSTPVALSPLGDLNAGHDIVLADLDSGERQLITAGKDDESTRPDISSDGGRIVFESAATNVTGFDSNGHPDIFIYDVATTNFGRASTNDTGGATSVPTGITISADPDGAGDPAISGDGEFLVWLGNQVGFSLPDSNVSVYVKHISGAINNSVLVGEAYRYHLDIFGTPYPLPSFAPAIDFTGEHIVFHNASSEVVLGSANQVVDFNGAEDVFVAVNPIYVENLTANSDGDLLTNAVEIAFGTNPGATDTDGDGLSDFDEVNRDGDPTSIAVVAGGDSDPTNPDTDSDNLGDGIEAAYGADPSNANVVLHVSQSAGNDSNDGLSWATPLQTNAAGVAVNAAYSTGGTDLTNSVIVLYETGVYDELASAGGNNLLFVGGMTPTTFAPIDVLTTVFEANGSPNAMIVAGQNGIGLESIDFRHAGGAFGRSLAIDSSTVTVRNAEFYESLANSGGGVSINSSTVDFDEVHFSNNTASQAETGGDAGGAIHAISSFVTINRSRFTDNVAEGDGPVRTLFANGGAIHASSFSNVVISESVFVGNRTINSEGGNESGGGAVSVASGSTLSVENSRFINNSADGHGGAILFSDAGGGGGQLTLNNNLFVANVSNDASAGTNGGAVAVIDGLQVDFFNNTVAYNQNDTAGIGGGSSGIDFASSGALNPPPGPAVYIVENNILRGNQDILLDVEEDSIRLDGSLPATMLDRQFNNVEFNSDVDDIDNDPIFENGYYLGNQAVNLSVDAGSDTAFARGLAAPFTTRIDGTGDTTTVDLGFHYQQGNQQFVSAATASPGVGACTGDVVQEFTLSDLDGKTVESIRTVAAELVSSDPGLGVVTLVGVGSIDPTGAGGVLLGLQSNGSYQLTIQTDQATQLGDVSLDIYVDDMASPITSTVITYPGPC